MDDDDDDDEAYEVDAATTLGSGSGGEAEKDGYECDTCCCCCCCLSCCSISSLVNPSPMVGNNSPLAAAGGAGISRKGLVTEQTEQSIKSTPFKTVNSTVQHEQGTVCTAPKPANIAFQVRARVPTYRINRPGAISSTRTGGGRGPNDDAAAATADDNNGRDDCVTVVVVVVGVRGAAGTATAPGVVAVEKAC
jgi:hypothetical protein